MPGLIEEKVYKFGEKVPAEPELARVFGVSRATIREVLRFLADEGDVIIIRHGLGTFVAGGQAHVKSDIEGLNSITKAIKQRNRTPGTVDALMYEEIADDEIAERLQMSKSGPDRFDVDEQLACNCNAIGIMAAIGSDSHSTRDMSLLNLSVGVARHAWSTKSSVPNARPTKGLLAWLAARNLRAAAKPR